MGNLFTSKKESPPPVKQYDKNRFIDLRPEYNLFQGGENIEFFCPANGLEYMSFIGQNDWKQYVSDPINQIHINIKDYGFNPISHIKSNTHSQVHHYYETYLDRQNNVIYIVPGNHRSYGPLAMLPESSLKLHDFKIDRINTKII